MVSMVFTFTYFFILKEPRESKPNSENKSVFICLVEGIQNLRTLKFSQIIAQSMVSVPVWLVLCSFLLESSSGI